MPAGLPEWKAGLTWPPRPADSAGSAQTDLPGSAAGEGMAAGGAGLAAGAGDVAAAGGVAGVCASAPETRRGSAASAPVNKTRSVMRQDPGETRVMRAPDRFTMHIKVTNSSPRALSRQWRGLFAHYAACPRNAKAAPRGGLLRTPRRSKLSLDTGREPVVAAAPEAGEAKTADTKRHKRPRRRFRRRISSRPVGQPDCECTVAGRDRNPSRIS